MEDSESDFDINEFINVDNDPGNPDKAVSFTRNSPQRRIVESAGGNVCTHITPVFAARQPNLQVRS